MMTLQQIRDARPCADGWRTLLDSLGGNPPMDTVVSLGDIARSNGAADAFWAVRCTDWPTIRDTMHDRVLVPLISRATYAAAAYTAAATAAAAYAADADDATAADAYAAYAAYAADADDARVAEREKQCRDIIAAFPPLH